MSYRSKNRHNTIFWKYLVQFILFSRNDRQNHCGCALSSTIVASFLESSVAKVFLTVLVFAQVLIISLHFDRHDFSLIRFGKASVTTHADAYRRLRYKHLPATTTMIESNNSRGLKEGTILQQNHVVGCQSRHSELFVSYAEMPVTRLSPLLPRLQLF
jgi:hypothetical protein